MGYNSFIYQETPVKFNPKYRDIVNKLTNLSYSNYFSKDERDNVCSFSYLYNIIEKKENKTKEDLLVQEVLHICTLLDYKQRDFKDFRYLFYTFNKDGYLELDDYFVKNYSDIELIYLVCAMADYSIEQEIDFLFEGEDSEHWGFRIITKKNNELIIQNLERIWRDRNETKYHFEDVPTLLLLNP